MKSRCGALLPLGLCLMGSCRSTGSAEQPVAPVVVAIPSQGVPEPIAAPSAAVVAKGPPRFVGLTANTRGDGYCAWRDDGTLWCWGRSASGRWGLGFETQDKLFVPSSEGSRQINCSFTVRQVLGPVGVTEVALGVGHGCAIDGARDLWCWGEWGDWRESQDDANGPPVRVQLHNIVHVTAAIRHTCASNQEGNVYCWGPSLPYGILSPSRNSPTLVPELAGAKQVLARDGSVVVIDRLGQLSTTTREGRMELESKQIVRVWANWGYVFGAADNGTIWSWSHGTKAPPIRYPEFDQATGIALGDSIVCANFPEGNISCASPIRHSNDKHSSYAVRGLENIDTLLISDTSSLGEREDGDWMGTGCALTRDGEVLCFGTHSFACDANVYGSHERRVHRVLPGARVAGSKIDGEGDDLRP